MWPRSFTLINYEIVLGNEVIRSAYLITIARTIIGTIVGMIVTLIAAYGLSYTGLPFRKGILAYVLITMLFSGGLVPLSKPMLAALGLFTAVGHWNDWFAGAFYVSDQSLFPVQTFLQQLLNASDLSAVMGSNNNQEALARGSQQNITLMSIKMAVVMVSAIPILCVYPFLQKYFVKGVLIGSVKG